MNTAIIVAAGSGKRFGAEKPKQFLELAGKPVLVHTLERFQACPAIDEIVLVLSAAEVDNFAETLEKFDLSKLKAIVAGGATRAASVLHGLNAIESKTANIIAVHDGARPLVTIEEITRAIEKAHETGAAILAAPVTDTIKEISNDGKILQTVDRTKLRRALTPQCFRYDILRRAFEENKNLEAATDESSLVEQIGVKVAIVEGSARNIKITVSHDLEIAEILLSGHDK